MRLRLVQLVIVGTVLCEEWNLLVQPPTCVQIPRNMTLCYGIGYQKMRLPNLLEHDTMAEVSQQASSWLPLLNVQCHMDSQLFLCSLFSPVCLDRPIYPCRSLCETVKKGCEGRMKNYGFPWPDMFDCEKFPLDNDMCITPQAVHNSLKGDNTNCLTCNQAETYENILDNFCRSEFAIRAKFRYISKHKLTCKKPKVLKGNNQVNKKLNKPVLTLESKDKCCESTARSNRNTYLIMGVFQEDKLIPRFIMPWRTKNSKPFKRAVRMFKKLNCSDPKLVSQSVINDAFPKSLDSHGHKAQKKNNSSLSAKTNNSSTTKLKGVRKSKKRKYSNSTG